MTRRGSDKTSLLDETFLPLGAELEATGRSRKGGNIQDISSLPGIIHKYWEGLDFFFFFFLYSGRIWLTSFATLWTATHQAPLSIRFPRCKNTEVKLPFPTPGGLPDPGIEPTSPALQADSLLLSHQGSPSSGVNRSKSFYNKDKRAKLKSEG